MLSIITALKNQYEQDNKCSPKYLLLSKNDFEKLRNEFPQKDREIKIGPISPEFIPLSQFTAIISDVHEDGKFEFVR